MGSSRPAASLPAVRNASIAGVALLGPEESPRRPVVLIGSHDDDASRGDRASSPFPVLSGAPARAATPPAAGPPATWTQADLAEPSNRSRLLSEYFLPPVSQLGRLLRGRCPNRARTSSAAATHAQSLSSGLAHRASHVASHLPPSAIGRILDRKSRGSSGQVGQSSRLRLATDAIKESGGKDGSSLLPKMTTLANFADFAAAGGFPDEHGNPHFPVDIFSVQIGDALVAEYLRWERARGYKEGSKGLAVQALTNLRFARDHLGLDAPDLTSDLVSAAAQPSVDYEAGEEVPRAKGSGTIPLRLVAGQEQLANTRNGRGPEDLSLPAFIWVCLRIIALVFGLRGMEMRSARIEPDEEDIRYIKLSFHPKGEVQKPRIIAWRWAFGVMGEFLWWPAIRTILLGLSTLEPSFQQPGKPKVAGNVLKASRLAPGLAPPSSTAWLLVTTISPFGLSPEIQTELGIQKHSAHGTIADVIGVYGGELCFDVILDALASGHWIPSSGSTGAGGGGRSTDDAGRRGATAARTAAAAAAQMPNRYRNGEHRGTPRVEGPRVIWSVLSLSFYSISESGLALGDIDPLQGWLSSQSWALAHKDFAYPSEPLFSTRPFASSVPLAPVT